MEPSVASQRTTGVGWAPSGPRAEDMSLQVSGVDHSGREALELHRSLVAIEQVHPACSGWVKAPSKLPRSHTLPPAQPGVLPKTQPSNTLPSGPPGHTQVLPELGLDSNLQQLVLKQDPTILTHEPGRGWESGWQGSWAPHCPRLPFPPLQNSLVEQFVGFWDGRTYVLGTWAGERKK